MDRLTFGICASTFACATLFFFVGCDTYDMSLGIDSPRDDTATVDLLGEEAVTNYYIVSDSQLKRMWTRQPVMATEDDEIIDASGTLVSYADAVAQSNAIASLNEISEAASRAMTNSINYLLEYTNQIPASAQHISMFFKPDTLNTNLSSYVVHETTDGVTDTQYVWYNSELSLAPIRYVNYISSSGTNTVKCKWWNWTAAGDTMTVNGNTWEGVHKCTITRPVDARYEMCRTTKNDIWGSANGFAFGSMSVFVNGNLAYTGVVSNEAENVVLTFKHGAYMGQTAITNAVEETTSGE